MNCSSDNLFDNQDSSCTLDQIGSRFVGLQDSRVLEASLYLASMVQLLSTFEQWRATSDPAVCEL